MTCSLNMLLYAQDFQLFACGQSILIFHLFTLGMSLNKCEHGHSKMANYVLSIVVISQLPSHKLHSESLKHRKL